MQHHVHATRPAPHIRAGHHHNHVPLHPSIAAVLPPDQQHMVGLTAAPATLGAQQQQQQQQPQCDHHHTRASHRHHHTQQANGTASYHQNSNQMQKIRQQHQHVEAGNSHGHAKCIPHQSYNHIPAPNVAPLSYNQIPHHITHLGGYAAQPPTYYVNNAKPAKYSANSNSGSHYIAIASSNNYAPKTILQNTYRHSKTNGQLVTTEATQQLQPVAVETSDHSLTTTANGNNIVITPDVNVSADTVEQSENVSDVDADGVQSDNSNSNSRENVDTPGNLPNEDGSVSRNSKDKTPMCLVNELARYNKIAHQYRLTGESGPAHCKTFTVTLKLGEEEYSAEGCKIKKAQHMAASKAIEETTYKHPPPKVRRSEESNTVRAHITPTVELNALAMKLGQRTYYLLDPSQIPPADPLVPSEYAASVLLPSQSPLPPTHIPYPMRRNGNYIMPPNPMHAHVAMPPVRGMYSHQRGYAQKYQSRYGLPSHMGGHMMHGPPGPFAPIATAPCKITLFVGKQKFVGIGRTLQQAKHDAASRALLVLKSQGTNQTEETLDESIDEGDKKSPISQVHEIGIKRNMTVHFKVLREEGPAHMKNFITACIVGTIVTEGEGNGKKISKKRSAEKMLIELMKLPPLTPSKQTPMKRIKMKTPGKNATALVSGTAAATTAVGGRRKRTNTSIKEKPVELDEEESPITKLLQLQQLRKETEPVFDLLPKNPNESSRRREFIVEVSANGCAARGTGTSKKLAKRNAAQALLELLQRSDENMEKEEPIDYDLIIAERTKLAALHPPIETIEPIPGYDVPMVSTPSGPVPGILILRQNKKPTKKKEFLTVDTPIIETNERKEETNKVDGSTATTEPEHIVPSNNNEAKSNETTSESILNTSTGSNTSGVSSNSSNAGSCSAIAANSNSNSNNSSSTSNITGVHMKEQLLYLSKLLDFEVNFSDYPKGNHNEFLTIVTLSSNPPQICHGVGKSSDESQNEAARNALKILSELGLNNAKK